MEETRLELLQSQLLKYLSQLQVLKEGYDSYLLDEELMTTDDKGSKLNTG